MDPEWILFLIFAEKISSPMNELMIDMIGYTAMALVALSLAMSNIVWLRGLNLTGALVFVIYGVLITAWPVVILNAILVVMNAFHLVRLRMKH